MASPSLYTVSPSSDAVVYGVAVQYGAYASIAHNVFDWNRHAIEGDGRPGSGYEANGNLVLKVLSMRIMLPLFPHDGCVSTGVYVTFAQNIKRQFVTKGQLMSRFAIGAVAIAIFIAGVWVLKKLTPTGNDLLVNGGFETNLQTDSHWSQAAFSVLDLGPGNTFINGWQVTGIGATWSHEQNSEVSPFRTPRIMGNSL